MIKITKNIGQVSRHPANHRHQAKQGQRETKDQSYRHLNSRRNRRAVRKVA